jgi:hypothetical protein
MKRLFTVVEVFELQDRRTVVIPDDLTGQDSAPGSFPVELRRPDASRVLATLRIDYAFQRPPEKGDDRVYRFNGLLKTDIPIGTEVWFSDE